MNLNWYYQKPIVRQHFAMFAIFFNILLLLVLVPLLCVLMYDAQSPQPKCNNNPVAVSNNETRTAEDQYGRYCYKRNGGEESCSETGMSRKILPGNESVCCQNLTEIAISIFSQQMRSRLRTDQAKARVLKKVNDFITALMSNKRTAEIRPAAHLGILPNGNLTGPDSEAPRVQWEKTGERSFVAGGLIHGGDRLRVTTAGYYYVYTGLQFSVDPRTVDTGAIVAYLYRHLNGTEESRRKLMTSRESSCKMTRGDVAGPVSMHMAGLYLLREGDEISVRTGSQSLLNRDPATTYMGMHMV